MTFRPTFRMRVHPFWPLAPLLLRLRFESGYPFLAVVKRTGKSVCLTFELVEFLFLARRRRDEWDGGNDAERRPSRSGSLPTGHAGSVVPISPPASAAASTALASKSTSSRGAREAGSRIARAKTCCASCHRAHSGRACSISTWHFQNSFLQKDVVIVCNRTESRDYRTNRNIRHSYLRILWSFGFRHPSFLGCRSPSPSAVTLCPVPFHVGFFHGFKSSRFERCNSVLHASGNTRVHFDAAGLERVKSLRADVAGD